MITPPTTVETSARRGAADGALFAAFRDRRDTAALEALVVEHWPPVFRVILRRVLDRAPLDEIFPPEPAEPPPGVSVRPRER